jgi:acetyl coenzyme A synthetase (ADP forming)-like protein
MVTEASVNAHEPDSASPGYPAECECDVVLADGSEVHIRPIRPDDAERLVAFHEHLSPETVYRRFFSAHPHLRPDEVERFTHVNYQDRLALVGLIGNELVGVARFDRMPDPSEAEVAFVVADAVQGRGLGTILLEHLATAARQRGISQFVADTLLLNSDMLRVFRHAGFEEQEEASEGIVRVTFPIAPTDAYQEAVDQRDRVAQARSMTRLLCPRSIAVVGAGRRPQTIGHEILRNLVEGGYTGGLFVVNPAAQQILGVPSFPSLHDVPADIDVVIVVVPAPQVSKVISDAGQRHAHAVVVISAGFAEMGAAHSTDEHELVSIARQYGMRLVGPNCLGILNTNPVVSMNATFSPARPARGRAAFVSQSGALGIAVLNRARQSGVGISSFVSVGNKADISSNDLLQYWETDGDTSVVLLYLESFGNPRKFARVARRVSRAKPIIAVKSGRSGAGRRGAQSHTAAAATPDVAVDALFHQAGVIRVDTLSDLLDTASLLATQPLPKGPRVAIAGNSGGPGILAADACAGAGLEVPELAAATQVALRSVLPAEASVVNPVDMLASASADDYQRTLRVLLDDDAVDAVIVVFTPPLVTDPGDVAGAIAQVSKDRRTKPVLAAFLAMDGTSLAPPTDEPSAVVPAYSFPEQAAQALGRVHQYALGRERPVGEKPLLEGIAPASAARLIEQALSGSPDPVWLSPHEAGELLSCYGIPVVRSVEVHSGPEAGAAARSLGFPVALKGFGPTLVHKSELGAVQLDLGSMVKVRRAYDAMAARLGNQMQGATVQPMAAAGIETIVGLIQDPAFGPLIMFGLGGVATELLADRQFRILPLTDRDAADLVRSVRAAPLLTGYRGSTPTNVAALEELLLRIGRLGENHPQIAELDLNPVIIGAAGATAVDAKVRLAPAPMPADPTQRRLR